TKEPFVKPFFKKTPRKFREKRKPRENGGFRRGRGVFFPPLPAGFPKPSLAFRLSQVDEEHFLTEVDASPARFVLRAHQVALWKSGV
ncbi:MAG: hypothetical protein IIX93_05735, partial [Clostridia bacterium]|nr:hypothetical protein [Clostridia bacterium]